MPTAPRDSPCLYCGRKFTKKGVYEHERHSCRKNPNCKKRSFGKKRCPYCAKKYHAAGLRAHIATQHPLEFAQEKARRRPSSRAAQRRRVVEAEANRERDRRHRRKTHDHHSHPPHRSRSSPAAPAKNGEKEHRREANGISARALSEMQRHISRAAKLQPGNAQAHRMSGPRP